MGFISKSREDHIPAFGTKASILLGKPLLDWWYVERRNMKASQ
jgi:hypothetical protein